MSDCTSNAVLERITGSLELALQWLVRASVITPRPENAEALSMLYSYASSEVGYAQGECWQLPIGPVDRETREAIHLVRFFIELGLESCLIQVARWAVDRELARLDNEKRIAELNELRSTRSAPSSRRRRRNG
jgi:hypothetical protein